MLISATSTRRVLDVAALSDAPLVATTPTRTGCARAPDLTDKELATIRETGGDVG